MSGVRSSGAEKFAIKFWLELRINFGLNFEVASGFMPLEITG